MDEPHSYPDEVGNGRARVGPRRARARTSLVLALVLVVTGAGGCSRGGDDTVARSETSVTTTTTTTTEPPRRAAPRWETVVTLTGNGPQETDPFRILPHAIQWRVRWSCEQGNVRITTIPPPRRGRPLAEDSCGKEGTAFAVHSGDIRLHVETDGAWRAIVDQQLDVPLDEQPLPGMTPETVVAEGVFYDVEKTGRGQVRLHRLPDGRRLLRFEDFETSHNTDLFVWLTDAAHPTTSAEAVAAGRVVVGNLKSTLGSQNYEVPAELPPERIRSIVIWCQPVSVAYAAAALAAQRAP